MHGRCRLRDHRGPRRPCRALDGHDERGRQLLDLRAVQRRRSGGPVPARHDGGRPRRFHARHDQRARGRPVPRRRQSALRSQPRRHVHPRRRRSDGGPHVRGAGAGRLLRHRRGLPGPARPHDGDALHRNDRDAGDLRQRQGRRSERPDRLSGRRVQERRVLRRERVHPRRQPGHPRGRRPERTVGANLRARAATTSPTCSAGMPGGDIAIGFTLAETAGLEVEFQQSGPQHLRALPDARPRARLRRRSAVVRVRATRRRTRSRSSACRRAATVFIVKAQNGAGRDDQLRLSAFSGTARSSCATTASTTTTTAWSTATTRLLRRAGCPAPACMPDASSAIVLVGHAADGDVRSRSSGTLYTTSCASGGGKERWCGSTCRSRWASARLHADRRLRCWRWRAGEPLDPCDVNELVCADPTCCRSAAALDARPAARHVQRDRRGLPAGQRGHRQPDADGHQERSVEICNNGIDDDGDGATTAPTASASPQPICARFTAAPTRPSGLLPLDGTPVSVRDPDGDGHGRSDRAVRERAGRAGRRRRLPGPRWPTSRWNGPRSATTTSRSTTTRTPARLRCGKQFACVQSGGIATGTHVFTKPPPGRYHMVVDADAPGKEGGVVLQFSAASRRAVNVRAEVAVRRRWRFARRRRDGAGVRW